jgi:acyl dehydratase
MTVDRVGEAAEAFEYDESVIGVEVDVGSFDVTREQIEAYCEAVGETNPIYTNDAYNAIGPLTRDRYPHGAILAPPGMLHTMPVSQGLDPKLQVHFKSNTFHAGQKMEIFAPIHPDDSIRARAQVKEIYDKTGRTGRMVFVVRRISYVNQDDKVVAAIESSFVNREMGTR